MAASSPLTWFPSIRPSPRLQILQRLTLPLDSERIPSGASVPVSMSISTGYCPFSMEAYGFIDSPAVRFLRDFATSTSSYSGSLGGCLHISIMPCGEAGNANLPCTANQYFPFSESEPRPGLGFDP